MEQGSDMIQPSSLSENLHLPYNSGQNSDHLQHKSSSHKKILQS